MPPRAFGIASCAPQNTYSSSGIASCAHQNTYMLFTLVWNSALSTKWCLVMLSSIAASKPVVHSQQQNVATKHHSTKAPQHQHSRVSYLPAALLWRCWLGTRKRRQHWHHVAECRHKPDVLASARITISAGSTSGTPPTLLLTTSSPQLAASRIAMQNA